MKNNYLPQSSSAAVRQFLRATLCLLSVTTMHLTLCPSFAMYLTPCPLLRCTSPPTPSPEGEGVNGTFLYIYIMVFKRKTKDYLLHLGAQEETFNTAHVLRNSMTEAEKVKTHILRSLADRSPLLLQEKGSGVEVGWRMKFRRR